MKWCVFLAAALALSAADPSVFESRKAEIGVLLEKRDFATALQKAQEINREWPDDISGYQLLAAAHLGLGNYTEAEPALQWMIDLRIGKADARGWLLVARFREVTGDIEGAIDAVNAGYARLGAGEERQRVALLALSGRLQFLSGQLVAAERVLHEALAAAPADEASLETLARVRIAQGRHEGARDIFGNLARSTGQPRYLYQLARESGDAAVYARFEHAARERMSSRDNANHELVLFYAGAGKRPAEALEIARREAALRHDVFTREALAFALNANGRSAEARSVMKEVLAVGTRDPEILRHAAQIGVNPR